MSNLVFMAEVEKAKQTERMVEVHDFIIILNTGSIVTQVHGGREG